MEKKPLIHKLFKKQVLGKENLKEGITDALVFYDEDFRRVIKVDIKEEELEHYQPLLDADELQHVYVKMLNEKDYVITTEEEYESFRDENIEEYI